MAKNNTGFNRLEITMPEGVNTLVSATISKKGEFDYVENARCKIIGTIEKRQGTGILGNNITATANHGIFYFENSNASSTGFFRISTVGGVKTFYYLSTGGTWTAISDITNASTSPSPSISQSISQSSSPSPSISPSISQSISQSVSSSSSLSQSTSSSVSQSASISQSVSASLSASSSPSSADVYTDIRYSTTIAEGCCFMVNGQNSNRYLDSDGVTITSSNTLMGHLYNSPIASVINYYKDRLYLGDYTSGGTRHKNGIMMSSMPLGILALIDGDHAVAECEVGDYIKVTDTKYIYGTDELDIYRGNTKIAHIHVDAKTESTFKISTITFESSYTTIDSSDEVWVADTFTGTKVFRWSGNPSSGVEVKEYDTFKIAGSQNDPITMMADIGNVMVIANKSNLAIWDESAVTNLDLGIGCTSKHGFVKTTNGLFFLAYDGIYKTTGSIPELMSSKIESYITGATKEGLESASMGKKGKSIFCYIGTTTLYNPDGSTKKILNDVVLEYNMRTTNWYVHTGIKAEEFATYISSDDTDRLIFSSNETGHQIMEFLYNSTTDNRISSNQEIPFRIDTGNIYLSSSFENFAYPIQIVAEIERGAGMTCWISLDDGDWYENKGNLVKGVNVIKIENRNKTISIPPRCRKINISLRDNSLQFCKLSRFAIIYSLSSEEDSENIKNI